MGVKNMTSAKGNFIANQFIITDHSGARYFQSYNSVIVQIDKTGQVFLDAYYWNYSRTTSKYRSAFLGECTKETQARIDSGEYVLTDLN